MPFFSITSTSLNLIKILPIGVGRVGLQEHAVILDTVQHVPNHGRERLQIVKLNMRLMQQLRKKSGLLEAPCLRAKFRSQQVCFEDPALYFLEFPWCSSR